MLTNGPYDARRPSGHVFRVSRKRGPVWYAKYRLPDGRQVQRKLGPAWTERGRPPAGYLTRRAAEDRLREVLDQALRGTLPGMIRKGATFADAAAEFQRYVRDDQALKPSTLRGYASIIGAYLLPAFSERRLEDITTAEVEHWRAELGAVGRVEQAEAAHDAPHRLSVDRELVAEAQLRRHAPCAIGSPLDAWRMRLISPPRWAVRSSRALGGRVRQ